ncbi:tRNA (adenosine(37)-N6)-threonylcarbamoyltransferase complex ATPase subunit type 1 TsaE [Deferribacter autotrophicus]|uniref:tRNA (adenosine(37)-N6)-threonylcarbamoyltransferase complex ATPase subunit type 1 TsaE n=1 Tax=Deferribacter autotrophicus TaxID=500465 RepID=UPI00165D8369|nr:tRNA (adenosine(37)-N6)-threonylcarbamoyltransferase complex ATPase subunit type 1 TsaE [Deferribacter autotrophicus]
MKHISNSINDTEKIAEQFANNLKGSEIILLEGDLGAGKTFFVKSVAKSIGCSDVITSPTFTLMQTYSGGEFTIFHFDLYRIKNFIELENFGFFEYLEEDGIKFVEWAERVNLESMLDNYIKINIEKTGEFSRVIEIFYKKGE